MLKRGWLVIPMLLCLLSVGCTQAGAPSGGDQAAAADYVGKIVEIGDGTLLLASLEEGEEALCTAGFTDISLTDAQGKALAAQDLRCGMVVSVGYDGTIQETFPAQLSQPVSLAVQKQDDDLVGFYLAMLQDLYDVDPGLNDGATRLAFDLEGAENLTTSEKSALIWLAAQAFQLDTFAATYDDLVQKGIVTADRPHFTDGMLITLSAGPVHNGSFTFQAQKWRSGTGAYYFIDCTARQKDGVWQYTIGSEAIS